ncbi:MAG: FeoB-associated Cys-rich membrane protein [Spirochaetaceae bacterium]|nr:FeoB-associated Cys-rich membrane protein [Spirochaetaceae bacterium]
MTNVIVAGVVLLALAFTVHRVVRRLKRGGCGCGCGGCGKGE